MWSRSGYAATVRIFTFTSVFIRMILEVETHMACCEILFLIVILSIENKVKLQTRYIFLFLGMMQRQHLF